MVTLAERKKWLRTTIMDTVFPDIKTLTGQLSKLVTENNDLYSTSFGILRYKGKSYYPYTFMDDEYVKNSLLEYTPHTCHAAIKNKWKEAVQAAELQDQEYKAVEAYLNKLFNVVQNDNELIVVMPPRLWEAINATYTAFNAWMTVCEGARANYLTDHASYIWENSSKAHKPIKRFYAKQFLLPKKED